MPLMSRRAYARHRGVTLRAVQKAIKAGRIQLVGDKIDAQAADAQWHRNTDPDQQMRAAGVLGHPDPSQPRGGQEPQRERFIDARTRRELAHAEIAEKRLAEIEGRIVQAGDVKRAVETACRTARNALLAIPDRLAHSIAAESDPAKVAELLNAEFRRICVDLAAAMQGQRAH